MCYEVQLKTNLECIAARWYVHIGMDSMAWKNILSLY